MRESSVRKKEVIQEGERRWNEVGKKWNWRTFITSNEHKQRKKRKNPGNVDSWYKLRDCVIPFPRSSYSYNSFISLSLSLEPFLALDSIGMRNSFPHSFRSNLLLKGLKEWVCLLVFLTCYSEQESKKGNFTPSSSYVFDRGGWEKEEREIGEREERERNWRERGENCQKRKIGIK